MVSGTISLYDQRYIISLKGKNNNLDVKASSWKDVTSLKQSINLINLNQNPKRFLIAKT